MDANREGLLTVREAARLAGRSPETVRRWIWDGKLPARKMGNQLFIKKESLSPLLAGQQTATQATRLAAIEEASELADRIGRRIQGTIDVQDLLDRSRESHPRW